MVRVELVFVHGVSIAACTEPQRCLLCLQRKCPGSLFASLLRLASVNSSIKRFAASREITPPVWVLGMSTLH